jgi:hypothetical protein
MKIFMQMQQLQFHTKNIMINTENAMAMSFHTKQNRNVVKTTSQVP